MSEALEQFYASIRQRFLLENVPGLVKQHPQEAMTVIIEQVARAEAAEKLLSDAKYHHSNEHRDRLASEAERDRMREALKKWLRQRVVFYNSGHKVAGVHFRNTEIVLAGLCGKDIHGAALPAKPDAAEGR